MKFNIDDLKPFEKFLKGVKYRHCLVEVQHEKVLKDFVPVLTYTIDMRVEDLEEFKTKFEEFKNENYDKISMYYFDITGFGNGINYFVEGSVYFCMKWIGR